MGIFNIDIVVGLKKGNNGITKRPTLPQNQGPSSNTFDNQWNGKLNNKETLREKINLTIFCLG
jgi:hypothetical protein